MEKVKNISLLLKEMLENQGVDYTITVFQGLVNEAIQTKNESLEKSASAVLNAIKKKYHKET
jgi:CRISPR/Cas system type I-B associated protein Csh2 (Cas7 group RAMP superfamily)